MIPEATQEKQVNKNQNQELTDLTSFNAYGVVTLSNSQRVNVQFTMRHGIPFEKAFEDAQKFIALLDKLAVDQSVEFWDGSRKADAAPTNGKEPTGEKPKRNYKDPLPPAEVPEELADTNEDVYAAEFDMVKVLPQPDDKATVEFWKDGLEYAVGAKINKWKHETVKHQLSRLSEEIDPAKAAEYRIAGTVYWVLGNEYTITKGPMKGQTSRYKNLVLVKAAF